MTMRELLKNKTITPLFPGMRKATEPEKLARIKELIISDENDRGHFWMANRNMARGVVLKYPGSTLTVSELARACRYLEELLACTPGKQLADWPENDQNTALSAVLGPDKHPN